MARIFFASPPDPHRVDRESGVRCVGGVEAQGGSRGRQHARRGHLASTPHHCITHVPAVRGVGQALQPIPRLSHQAPTAVSLEAKQLQAEVARVTAILPTFALAKMCDISDSEMARFRRRRHLVRPSRTVRSAGTPPSPRRTQTGRGWRTAHRCATCG